VFANSSWSLIAYLAGYDLDFVSDGAMISDYLFGNATSFIASQGSKRPI